MNITNFNIIVKSFIEAIETYPLKLRGPKNKQRMIMIVTALWAQAPPPRATVVVSSLGSTP